jgi:hypothetical protein
MKYDFYENPERMDKTDARTALEDAAYILACEPKQYPHDKKTCAICAAIEIILTAKRSI